MTAATRSDVATLAKAWLVEASPKTVRRLVTAATRSDVATLAKAWLVEANPKETINNPPSGDGSYTIRVASNTAVGNLCAIGTTGNVVAKNTNFAAAPQEYGAVRETSA